jgi:hypothetical protein
LNAITGRLGETIEKQVQRGNPASAGGDVPIASPSPSVSGPVQRDSANPAEEPTPGASSTASVPSPVPPPGSPRASPQAEGGSDTPGRLTADKQVAAPRSLTGEGTRAPSRATTAARPPAEPATAAAAPRALTPDSPPGPDQPSAPRQKAVEQRDGPAAAPVDKLRAPPPPEATHRNLRPSAKPARPAPEPQQGSRPEKTTP